MPTTTTEIIAKFQTKFETSSRRTTEMLGFVNKNNMLTKDYIHYVLNFYIGHIRQ